MPTDTIKKVSKVCQLKLSNVENMWNESKAAAEKSAKNAGHSYALAMFIFKKKLSKSCLKKLDWKRTGKSGLNHRIWKRLQVSAGKKDVMLNLIQTHEGSFIADVFSGSNILKNFEFGPKLTYWYKSKAKKSREKVKELLSAGIKINNLKDLIPDIKGKPGNYTQPKKPKQSIYLYSIVIDKEKYLFGVRKTAKILKKFDFYQEKTYWRRVKDRAQASSVVNELVNSKSVNILNKAELVQQKLYISRETTPVIPTNNIRTWKDVWKLDRKKPIFFHSTVVKSTQDLQSVIFNLWERLDKLSNKKLKLELDKLDKMTTKKDKLEELEFSGHTSYDVAMIMFEENHFSLAGSTSDASDPSIVQAYLGNMKSVEKLFSEASIIVMPSIQHMLKVIKSNKKLVIPIISRLASIYGLFEGDKAELDKQKKKAMANIKKAYRPWKIGKFSMKLEKIV